MKHIAAIGAGVVALATSVNAGTIDTALQPVLRGAPADEIVSTLVYLADRTDLVALSDALDAQRTTLHERHEAVVLELQAAAAAAQGPLLDHLAALQAQGLVRDFEAFWVANAIRVDAPKAQITALAARDDVEVVFLNHPIESVRPAFEGPHEQGGGIAGSDPEPGIDAVRAPEVWALGITGAGTLVSTLDTGVDGNHPALASRWRGLDPAYTTNPEWAFFDPVTNQTFPFDSGDHGTHTMGSVCGGMPGDQVGVAPGAEWIHAAVIDRVSIAQTVSDAILSFQWILDPDEDPGTSFDVPDVNSNSWGVADFHGYPDCDPLFWEFLDACETAGIVMVFAAGNEGFSGLRRPADRATDDYRTFAVAAVDGNNGSYPIAGFSSRGPTNCTPDGSNAIKPDIAGPGVNVRSSVPGGGYSQKSGTSMSTPHLCGVVSLLREAVPNLTVEQIKQVIYDTAFDLGAPDEDNDYGHGMVDAFEAVTTAINTYALDFEFPEGRPDLIDPFGGETISLTITGSANPLPETAMLHYSDGGPFVQVALEGMGGDSYQAVFPEFDCGAEVAYYFSVETESGNVVFNPIGAPADVYGALAYTGRVVEFTDDFQHDNDWTVVNDKGLTGGAWERAIPAGGGDVGDPPADGDGSGFCYVTDNAAFNSDVDGGSTTLVSPVMDASQIDEPMIAYWRWFSNHIGAAPYEEVFLVEVSDDAGQTWTTLETVGPGDENDPNVAGGWIRAETSLAGIVAATDQFQVRFTASDTADPSVIEAGVDGVELSSFFCDDGSCPADVTGDNEVNVLDLVEVVLNWGDCPGCPADVTGNGVIDVEDLVALIVAWGPCG